MLFDRSKEWNKTGGFLTVSPCSFETPNGSSSMGERAQYPEGCGTRRGQQSPRWWQMWTAHGDASPWVLPELCLAGKDSQEPEVRFWETQGFQQWDLPLSFAFLMKKQFQTLPIISLYNTENSHNCPSSYFPKYKNKGKKFRYSTAFALKIYSD